MGGSQPAAALQPEITPATCRVAEDLNVCMKAKSLLQIIPALMVSGAMVTTTIAAEKLEGLSASTSIALGTVDDSGLGGTNADQAPAVTLTHARHAETH